ncbi:right-handed parallel beta-helix repeat-containing protein [Streptomyces paludis]|uniref:right-handed parallel beta-helix repeat-containing protein n=1 Tax=Streptomyces paludis TaxID=2282738 RepID=UPI001E33DC94|nr:right-handed parallel beta-helix repeat-containing protein [Streptomyces paludis]
MRPIARAHRLTALTAAGLLAAAGLLTSASTAVAAGPAAAGEAVAPAAADAPAWEAITFGQSTDLNFASNVLPEKVGFNYAAPEHPGTIDGRVVMESRGGKIAPGHDGLTFYHTTLNPRTDNFVLTADMTVDQLGPETGGAVGSQDSAGIMVRDVNGGARQDPMVLGYEEVPAASNIFASGVMRQGVTAIQRTGVVKPYGNTGSSMSATAFTTDSRYALPLGTPVTLRLERTDTEFIISSTFTHVGQPVTFERRVTGADWVQDIDPDHMYVGFYAARNAKVTFDNARLELSEAHTQPRPATEPVPVKPALTVLSPPVTSGLDYPLRARPNVDGTVEFTDAAGTVLHRAHTTAHRTVGHRVTLTAERTDFGLRFIPDDATSGGPVSQSLTVRTKAYGERGDGAVVHAAPEGAATAAGTAADPVDLATALAYVAPGGKVLLHGGTYRPTATVGLDAAYSGTKDRPKTVKPYRGAQVVLDGRGTLPITLRLDADHWRFEGFRVTGATGNGMRVSGSHNVIERMLFNYNMDSGFQMSGSGDNSALWPAHNLILNSESHDNRDLTDINADGFAAKLGVGAGNVFRGNVAHHNIDDGWDLYNRVNEGANMPVLLENNIAYANGRLSNGYHEDGDTGNGFKVGGEGLPVAHVVRGNIAFDNNMDGFSDNFNPGPLELSHNTAFDNKRFNFIMRFNPYFSVEEQGVYRDNLSFRTPDGRGGDTPVRDYISGDTDRTNVLFDGERATNEDATTIARARDFRSLTLPGTYTRHKDGSLIYGDFLRPTRHSLLNTAGTKGGWIGALDGGRLR